MEAPAKKWLEADRMPSDFYVFLGKRRFHPGRQELETDRLSALRSVCASLPEVGAQCGSSARWDLCGGRPVRAVPTAKDKHNRSYAFYIFCPDWMALLLKNLSITCILSGSSSALGPLVPFE